MKSFYITREDQNSTLCCNKTTNHLFLTKNISPENKIILSSENMNIGFLHYQNKIFDIVQIYPSANQYFLKSLINQCYFSSRPLQTSETTSPFIANRAIPKEWETFDLSLIDDSISDLTIFNQLDESFNSSTTKKHIVISIRYSILLNDARGWLIGQNTEHETYKKRLFSSQRLRERGRIFQSITLPSLQHIYQNIAPDTNFVVYLLTSEELPQEHKNVLLALQQEHPFLRLKFHNPSASLLDHFNEYLATEVKPLEMYASARLDDDDALSIEWLNKIVSYLSPTYNNKVIALSGGLALSLTPSTEIDNVSYYAWHFPSAGLTYIGQKGVIHKCIYQCGSHVTPYKSYETVFTVKGCYFARCFNNFNDSNDPFPAKSLIPKDQHTNALEIFGIKI